MLSDRQIELVQTSFAQVVPIADQAAEIFYNRLFEIAPDVRELFVKSDMKSQGNKLMQMIGTAVAALNNLELLVPAVKHLGVRHVGYGVTPEQYDTVGEALIWTLQQGLGDSFTDEVREAWTLVYTVLAETAIAGAAESQN